MENFILRERETIDRSSNPWVPPIRASTESSEWPNGTFFLLTAQVSQNLTGFCNLYVRKQNT